MGVEWVLESKMMISPPFSSVDEVDDDSTGTSPSDSNIDNNSANRTDERTDERTRNFLRNDDVRVGVPTGMTRATGWTTRAARSASERTMMPTTSLLVAMVMVMKGEWANRNPMIESSLLEKISVDLPVNEIVSIETMTRNRPPKRTTSDEIEAMKRIIFLQQSSNSSAKCR